AALIGLCVKRRGRSILARGTPPPSLGCVGPHRGGVDSGDTGTPSLEFPALLSPDFPCASLSLLNPHRRAPLGALGPTSHCRRRPLRPGDRAMSRYAAGGRGEGPSRNGSVASTLKWAVGP